jgi:hypothetical protein
LKYFILTFDAVHYVLKSEKLLEKEALVYDIIPTPREFSSDCGMAIRIDKNSGNLEAIKYILETAGINFHIHQK